MTATGIAAMRRDMQHLLLESYSTLQVTKLVPNPPMPRSIFEVRRRESH